MTKPERDQIQDATQKSTFFNFEQKEFQGGRAFPAVMADEEGDAPATTKAVVKGGGGGARRQIRKRKVDSDEEEAKPAAPAAPPPRMIPMAASTLAAAGPASDQSLPASLIYLQQHLNVAPPCREFSPAACLQLPPLSCFGVDPVKYRQLFRTIPFS